MGSIFKQKPISIEEAGDCVKFLDLDSQHIKVHNSGHRDLYITKRCPDCGKESCIMVCGVRKTLKKTNAIARCYSCVAKYRVTLPTHASRNVKRGKDHVAWKGERSITKQGYVRLYMFGYNTDKKFANSKNYVLEHRHVMEQHIGRRLSTKETVHHRNGNKLDNRLENLELWGSGHCKGQRYTDLSTKEITILIKELQNLIKDREDVNE